ncbi:hypothetical protein Tco_0389413 [Tanacetum coccineum]
MLVSVKHRLLDRGFGDNLLTAPEIIHKATERIIQIKNRIQTARDRQKSYADAGVVEVLLEEVNFGEFKWPLVDGDAEGVGGLSLEAMEDEEVALVDGVFEGAFGALGDESWCLGDGVLVWNDVNLWSFGWFGSGSFSGAMEVVEVDDK